ncbi:MAG: acyl-CoA dehydrogenase C-terminal domain-containing protein, partial [Acidimicrobiales bacterium]
VLSQPAEDPNQVLAGATQYLRLFGNVIGGWVLAKSALAAKAGDYEAAFADSKLVSARFYADQVLPMSAGLRLAASAGSADLFALAASQF